MGALGIWLSLRYRMPISIAWSTPGAALLVSTGEVAGGYPGALGAFLVTGLLIVAAGLWQKLRDWMGAIPVPIAAAMLAGVLLPAVVTFVVGASGITALSISSAFWGIVAGLAYLALHRLRHNGAPDREDEPS
jgi:benzoate membrane transport protein